MERKNKQYPAIKGLTWHRNQYYSFFVPLDWHRFAWPDDRQGEVHGPDINDPYTVFAVTLQDLGLPVTAADLDILAEGFFESIHQLPQFQLESHRQQATGDQLELEAKYTFVEDGNVRKCWVRVLYHQTRQITFAAKGATPDKYDYWLPLFFEAMMTANVHSAKPQYPVL